MRLFADVKIGKRLGIGFGVTLAMMVVIVVTGVVYLTNIKSSLERFSSVNVAKIRYANEIRTAFADITYLTGRIVTAQDKTVQNESKKRIDEIRANYKNAIENLEKLEINDEGKNLIAKIKEESAKGRDANNSAIEFGLAGKTKEAMEKYGDLTSQVQKYITAAEETIKYNEGRMQYRYEEAKKNAIMARWIFILLAAVNLVMGIFFSRAITRSITIPIMRSAGHIDHMAKGDFSQPISKHALGRKDEMGVFAKSMEAMNTNLGQMLKGVMISATNVASASTQLSASAEKLSSGAMNQVERATQVATASTEMNQASEDIAQNSNRITESASETVKIAKGGQEVVDNAINEVKIIAEAVETASTFVKDLGHQSEKIGDIITVINEIADQTNLLALNAAIEAARAGEQGRGFAVVADEVKKLAERTSHSTTEIGDMIKTIKEGVEKTVESMDKAKNNVVTGVEYSSQAQAALQNIISSIDNLHGGIQQIATAIEEMSATTNEITRDINQISDVTKENLTASEDISGASSGLSELAHNLEKSVKGFTV